MKLDYPEIKNWSFGITPNVDYCLVGHIYNSPKPQLADGLYVQTSAITRMFEEQGVIIVETKNSRYQIHKERLNQASKEAYDADAVWNMIISKINKNEG